MIFIKIRISYGIKVLIFVIAVLFFCGFFSVLGFHFANEKIPVFSEIAVNNSDFAKKEVILDAGHGGIDSGAVSSEGVFEKDINLAIANKTAEFLRAKGINVILTRNSDTMLKSETEGISRKTSDLKKRVEIANDFPEAIFVSIHQNALNIPSCRGLQVFYSENDALSKPLALKVQNNIKKYLTPENKREIKKGSGIYVLERISSPAILIECGFMSNPDEAKLLENDEYLTKLSFVIAHSISEIIYA